MDLENLITKHLTRYFDPNKKIPEETFELLLRYLRTSPTTINIQPIHFFVLETQAGKDKLADALVGRFEDNQEKVRNASHAIVFTTRKTIPGEHLEEIFAKERADGRFADPETQSGWEAGAAGFVKIQSENYGGDVLHWLEKNTYLVVGATMMAAASLGVDATPFEGFDRAAIDEAFGLTDTDFTTTLLMALGYPDETRVSRQPVSRFEAEKIFTRM
ncbi:nitroreductase family protein [Amycolatopsis sp. NPDC051372]|uniref:nitroreductase family protein n=1 Tax=Amycolatopsis sp. NPDC051372 TaxID=3155669 RepID=UPI003441FE35